jgi:uncharacterized membrane protein HdeD (DUF308 family)
MIQAPIKGRWLLAVCSVLEAVIAAIYLLTRETDGALTFGRWHGTLVLLGKLTLVAGICTVAAGVWSSGKGKSWLLVLNGLACSALGAVFAFWTGPLAFRTVALLITAMAITSGIYDVAAARLTGRVAEWLLGAAAVGSFGFAVAFLAFVVGWMKLQPGAATQSLHWLGSYFAFSALCMLGLSVGLHRRGFSASGKQQAVR